MECNIQSKLPKADQPPQETLPTQAPPLAGDFERWTDRLKETMPIAKDLLEVALKLSPLSLLAPSLMLWIYLHRIGWPELVNESVGSAPGLLSLLAGMVLLVFSLIFQFCIPSLLIAPISPIVASERGNTKVRRPLIFLCLGVPVVWTGSFAMLFWLWPSIGSITIGYASLVALAFDLVIVIWLRCKLNHKSMVNLLIIGACAMGAAFVSCFPLLVLTQIMETHTISDHYPLAVLLVCAIASAIGVLPGLANVISTLQSDRSEATAVLTLGTLMVVIYALGNFIFAMAPVSASVLTATGVYSIKPSVYQLHDEQLALRFRAAHIPVFTASIHGDAKPIKTFFAGAFLRYNFGDTKLLCEYPFSLTREVVTNENTPKNVSQALSPTQVSDILNPGTHCVQVKADDVANLH